MKKVCLIFFLSFAVVLIGFSSPQQNHASQLQLLLDSANLPTVTSSASGCENNNGIINITNDDSLIWNCCKVYNSLSVLVAIDSNITGNFSFTGLPGGYYRVEFDYGLYEPIEYVEVETQNIVAGLNVASNHGTVGESMQFYTANSNANQFHWDFGDGSIIDGVANPVYAYLFPGTYNVTVNCSNDFGCIANADTVVYIDYATSVNKMDGGGVRIVSDGKNVIIENAIFDYYSVCDISGREINAGKITTGETIIDFSNESSGIYVLSIKNSDTAISKVLRK